jgi:hypothetical protein
MYQKRVWHLEKEESEISNLPGYPARESEAPFRSLGIQKVIGPEWQFLDEFSPGTHRDDNKAE